MARCSHCQTRRAFSTQAGSRAMAQVLDLDGTELQPATAEVLDVHWCWKCWCMRFAPQGLQAASV